MLLVVAQRPAAGSRPGGQFTDPHAGLRAYDGLTEIWFENWDDHDAFFASENYRTLVNPDEARFIDMESVARGLMAGVLS
ncbi:EthD domain-containing protein [Streptomyces sp. LaBMicrA B280]|uniref:EthD domain-containing protein n=1 Tax=Streptomyces sp. LaBMicrA B280 TaxID=3391001 RepID=UPI003BA6702A